MNSLRAATLAKSRFPNRLMGSCLITRSPRPVSFIADFTAIHGAFETDCASIGRTVFIDDVFTHNLLFPFNGIDNVFFQFFSLVTFLSLFCRLFDPV
jgi:hypothetical protein